MQLKREAKLLTEIGLNTKHADCRIILHVPAGLAEKERNRRKPIVIVCPSAYLKRPLGSLPIQNGATGHAGSPLAASGAEDSKISDKPTATGTSESSVSSQKTLGLLYKHYGRHLVTERTTAINSPIQIMWRCNHLWIALVLMGKLWK